MFNIAKKKKKKIGWEIFWNSVKFTWDSTFVDALGPRDPIEIKPKSNTASTVLVPDRKMYVSHVSKLHEKDFNS